MAGANPRLWVNAGLGMGRDVQEDGPGVDADLEVAWLRKSIEFRLHDVDAGWQGPLSGARHAADGKDKIVRSPLPSASVIRRRVSPESGQPRMNGPDSHVVPPPAVSPASTTPSTSTITTSATTFGVALRARRSTLSKAGGSRKRVSSRAIESSTSELRPSPRPGAFLRRAAGSSSIPRCRG